MSACRINVPTDTSGTVRSLLATGALELALPASGATPSRLAELARIAREHSVGVARLAEAHTDAVAILCEAGRTPMPGMLYGVWASQGRGAGVEFDRSAKRLSGTMGFASGLGIVDRALITAAVDGGQLLVDADVRPESSSLTFDLSAWASPALADTATGPVAFDGHLVDHVVVDQVGWYLSRTGFWQGACGPAACWAGAARGLVDASRQGVDDNPHRRAHVGAMSAQAWSADAMLEAAGRQIDADPGSSTTAEMAARSVRFAVTTICRDVLDRFGRAFGPRPYTSDAGIAQRAIDLDLYIKQHHSERELPAIVDLHDRAPTS